MNYESYKFDDFEVHTHSGSLLHRGHLTRLQDLPFRMLVVLLRNQGRVVSREELRNLLWNQQTFVDFDKSLRVAATKLREALRDNAAKPRFIRTVSKRGYQFIAEATRVADPAVEQPSSPAPPVLPGETPPKKTRLGLVATICALTAVVLVVTGVLLYLVIHRPLVGNQDRIVLGGFTNDTGDATYDGILTPALRVKLEESPYLSLIADQRLLQLVANPDLAPLKSELDACKSLGGNVLVRGRISPDPPGYLVALTAWKCTNGRILTTQKATAGSKRAVLSALGLATEKLRRRFGESENSLQKYNVPLTQATTDSIAALKAFTLGEEKNTRDLDPPPISQYKFAIDLDPKFALAYAKLGTLYFNLGESSLTRKYYEKAFELRERTTDRERLYITAQYYALVTRESQRAIEAFEAWHTIYPRDTAPLNNLAVLYLSLGHPETAVSLAQQAVQLDSSAMLFQANLASAYLRTRDYARLASYCSDPVYRDSDSVIMHQNCFLAAVLRNDETSAQKQLQWARGRRGAHLLLNDAAWAALSRGKFSEARRQFSEARQNAVEDHLPEAEATIALNLAILEADIGLADEARKDALAILKLKSRSGNIEALAALTLARTGDIGRAQLEAANAASQSPSDTILNSAVLPSVYAAIHLQRHNPKAALQSLERARPFDFCQAMQLAPAYYRGLAYLEDKQLQAAAKEFQQVISHGAISPISPYISLSQLYLGRAFQLAGDRKNAMRAYDEAEAAWKDANPTFPPVKRLHQYQRELAAQN